VSRREGQYGTVQIEGVDTRNRFSEAMEAVIAKGLPA
jgi:hypothetical protein